MKILVVGDAIIDHYVYGTINRMSPEEPTIPIVDLDKEEYRMGGCLNVVSNLCSLSDAEVNVVSGISRWTSNTLREKHNVVGLPVFTARSKPDEKELIKTRVIRNESGQQLIRLDNHLKYDETTVRHVASLLEMKTLSDYDAIVVSDYNKGVVDSRSIDFISQFNGGMVFVDTKKHDLSIWDKIPSCIIKVNEKEWDQSTKLSRHKVIVTKGPLGAELRDTSDWHATVEFRTEPVKNPEVTGAGDVFISALTVNFLETKSLSKAIEFANLMAAESVKIQGTTETKRSDEV